MKYRYCSVLPVNQHTIYSYIADMDVQVHAFVEIPFGASNQITQGIVMEVTECTAETAPFPVEKTKHISRLITEDEYRKNIKPKFVRNFIKSCISVDKVIWVVCICNI